MVSVAKMFSVWGTKARPWRTFSCAGAVVISAPSRQTVPEWTGDEAGDRLDEGGLAGAVRAEEDDELALRDGEVDAADDRQVALVAGDKRAGLKDRGHAASPR